MGKELKGGVVVGCEGGQREDAGAIFREDLYTALVDEDAQFQAAVDGCHLGMTGMLELRHLEVGHLRAVDHERVATGVVGDHQLATASGTEVEAEGVAHRGVETHFRLVDVLEAGHVFHYRAALLQAALVMLPCASQRCQLLLGALHEAPSRPCRPACRRSP